MATTCGGDCVEAAWAWGKSAYSDGGSGDCVAVASRPTSVDARDSK
ncbi:MULTISPECIES: DUF397 domain-containing protein [unclassified Streptomyces]